MWERSIQTFTVIMHIRKNKFILSFLRLSQLFLTHFNLWTVSNSMNIFWLGFTGFIMYGLRVSDPEISIKLFLFTTLLSQIMLTILNPELVTLMIIWNINFDSSTDDIFYTVVNEITSLFLEAIDEIIKYWMCEAACSSFSEWSLRWCTQFPDKIRNFSTLWDYT